MGKKRIHQKSVIDAIRSKDGYELQRCSRYIANNKWDEEKYECKTFLKLFSRQGVIVNTIYVKSESKYYYTLVVNNQYKFNHY